MFWPSVVCHPIKFCLSNTFMFMFKRASLFKFDAIVLYQDQVK